MTREEKIAEARRLRRRGATFQSIAEELGVAFSTVWRWLNPEAYRKIEKRRRPYKRAWEDLKRATCPGCGRPMRQGSACPSKTPERCAGCDGRAKAEAAHDRAEQLEAWWNEGLSMNEIAQRLGCSLGSLGYRVDKARAKGYDLPYRHRYQKPVHSDQVAA